MRGGTGETAGAVTDNSTPLRSALVNRMRERAGSATMTPRRRSLSTRGRRRTNSLLDTSKGQRKITDLLMVQLEGEKVVKTDGNA